ncbi:thiol:disulfide interchange protein [bacterium]|nr:thiol:disulfide interchange protein [bacterium]
MKILSAVVALVLVVSCTNKDQLQKILMENPDILVEVMKKHPQKFQGVLNPPRQNAPTAADEIARREEEFKNPKKPAVDTARVILGNPKAPVTIVAYSDIQCPFCYRAETTMEELRKKYGNKVRYVFKHFPLPFHPLATPAAKTYEAIALQSKDKATQWLAEVFQNQQTLGQEKEAYLDQVAKKLGVNMERMKKDRDSEKVQKIVDQDIEEGKAMGVRGTPAFLVNGVFIVGARPAKDFEEIIDRWLKEG